ncbi:MAG TPA: CHAT domain-containing protein, partial [Phormidium sp.]
LDTLLRSNQRATNPIELLVFSACQTAAGDNRATLGLTGIAVRAGARSTVATLWNVDDEATALLMANFYKELSNSKVTKAEALRRAQQLVLQENQFSHPYFWSAFVLVGNWL